MAQSRGGGSKGRASGAGSKTSARGAAKSRSGAGASSRSAAKSRSGASSATRNAAAKKGGQARGRQQTARKAAGGASRTAAGGARRAGVEAKTVAEFRDAFRKNLIKPMELVLLSRERIDEVLGEAVDQGRVTTRDAQRISSGLVKRGQKQTSDVLKDLEKLLDRPTAGARKAAKRGAGAAKGVRGRATRTAAPALKQVDRVRRGAGVGKSFPITGYDDLTAPQVQSHLRDLTPAQLRKVRDHERRNSNRKTILSAIESKLR